MTSAAGDWPALVALGEPMVEFNQARNDAPAVYLRGFGGDTSNMAIAAARLGARVGYVTRLGNDAFGRLFRNLWQAEGVDMAGVATDDEAPTGVYFVTHGEHGHEFSYLRAGSAASRMRPETLPLDVIRSARLLHVSGVEETRRLAAKVERPRARIVALKVSSLARKCYCALDKGPELFGFRQSGDNAFLAGID